MSPAAMMIAPASAAAPARRIQADCQESSSRLPGSVVSGAFTSQARGAAWPGLYLGRDAAYLPPERANRSLWSDRLHGATRRLGAGADRRGFRHLGPQPGEARR